MKVKCAELATVRVSVLRNYYEHAISGDPTSAAAMGDARFEEAWRLMRITYPRISARRVAEMLPQFRSMAPTLPFENGAPESSWRTTTVDRRPEVDLQSLAEDDCQQLVFQTVGKVRNFSALASMGNVARVVLTEVGDLELGGQGSPKAVETLIVHDIREELLDCVLSILRSKELEIYTKTSLDAAKFQVGDSARILRLSAPRGVSGLDALHRLSLRILNVDAAAGEDIDSLVRSQTKTIEELEVRSASPWTLDLILKCARLREATVSVFPEQRVHLLELAVSCRSVGWRFCPPLRASGRKKRAPAPRVYRDMVVRRIDNPRRYKFEVGEDVLEGPNVTFGGDNADLEELVRRTLPDIDAEWSSERDTFVVRTRRLRDMQTILDVVCALREGRATTDL